MKFFDWLLRENKEVEFGAKIPVPEREKLSGGGEISPNNQSIRTLPTGAIIIPKWTHADKVYGAEIFCPRCYEQTQVRNFNWATLLCKGCGVSGIKREWYIIPKRKKVGVGAGAAAHAALFDTALRRGALGTGSDSGEGDASSR